MGHDPLPLVLRSVRRVGDEFCWPATDVLQILEAFERLERVILGAELWRFDGGNPEPTVVGWTEFVVPEGTWQERVAESSRLAAEELHARVSDPDAWVNLTWEDRDDPAP